MVLEKLKLSKHELLFIILAMVSSFLITGEASITKPVAHSLFMTAYGAESFPYVWIAVVPSSFFVVWVYNFLLGRIGCTKMLMISVGIGALINFTTAFFKDQFYCWPFAFYIWKDIYILLMFQQLWSVINATINISKARYLYGIFWGCGGVGSVIASFIPGLFATRLGTEKLLLFSLPCYILLAITYLYLMWARSRIDKAQQIKFKKESTTDFLEGIRLIRSSSLLRFILLIVLSMQIASTILDYQFNLYVEAATEGTDERTRYFGSFFGLVNSVNVALQFLGSFILIKVLGLKRCHLVIPVFLASLMLVFLFQPSFLFIALTYGSIKALDYSIFGVIKEMLYIPLNIDQKFKAKAVIDVFAYRSAKAIAAIAIKVFTILLLDYVTLFIFIIWSVAILNHFRKTPQKEQVIDLKKT